MKRKIFSKLLMGAFLVASVSMFVSCKDYDDDISKANQDITNLNAQLTSLRSDLTSQLSSAQSNLDGKIKELNDALAKKANASDLDNKANASDLAGKADASAVTEIQSKLNEVLGLAAQVSTLESKIAAIDNLSTQEKAHYDELKGLVESLTGQLKDEKDARAAAEKTINTQLDAFKAYEERIKKLEEDMKKVPTAAPEVDLSGIKADILKLTEDLKAVDATADVATLKGQFQTLSDAITLINDKLNAIEILVTKKLSSIVLIPNFYWEGIEGIEMPYVRAQKFEQKGGDYKFTYKLTDKPAGNNTVDVVVKSHMEWKGTGIVREEARFVQAAYPAHHTDYYLDRTGLKTANPNEVKLIADNSIYTFSNGAKAKYHINPASADLTGAKYNFYEHAAPVYTRGKGENVINTEIGDVSFEKGILTVPFTCNYTKVQNFFTAWTQSQTNDWEGRFGAAKESWSSVGGGNDDWDAYSGCSDDVYTGNLPFVSLEIDKDTLVNSDYAVVVPAVYTIVALADNGVDEALSQTTFLRPVHSPNPHEIRAYHLYETVGYNDNGIQAEDALYDNTTATPELRGAKEKWNNVVAYGAIPMPATHRVAWNDTIDLEPFIETHYNYDTFAQYGKSFDDAKMDKDLFKELGLSYEFTKVDYIVGKEVTSESEHIRKLEGGKFTPVAVDENGKAYADNRQNRNTIGREPLIRVDLKDKDGNIIRYGYIKLRIDENSTQPNDLKVDINLNDFYMNCGDEGKITWSQVEALILEKLGASGYSKQQFEQEYYLEVYGNYKNMPYIDPSKNAQAAADGDPKGPLYTSTWMARRYSEPTDGKYAEETVAKMTATNNHFGEVWYTPHDNSTEGHNWDEQTNVLIWNLYPGTVSRTVKGTTVGKQNAGNMDAAKYIKLMNVAEATYETQGISQKEITTTVRFRQKYGVASVWVTLHIPAKHMFFEWGAVENKDWSHWFQFNSPKEGELDPNKPFAKEFDAHMNPFKPSNNGYNHLTVTSYNQFLTDNWLDPDKMVQLKGNAAKFSMFYAPTAPTVQFVFTIPKEGVNSNAGADRQARTIKIDGKDWHNAWTVFGASTTEWTLVVGNRTAPADGAETGLAIWAIGKNGHAYTPEEVVYLDNVGNITNAQNNHIHYHGLEVTGDLYPAATDLINKMGAYDAQGNQNFTLGSGLTNMIKAPYLDKNIDKTFTVYLKLEVAHAACYEPLIGKQLFNVRIHRPINVAAKEYEWNDRVLADNRLPIKDLVEIVDWNRFPVVPFNNANIAARNTMFNIEQPAYSTVYNNATSMKAQNTGIPYEYYGISELAVRYDEIRTDHAKQPNVRKNKYYDAATIKANTDLVKDLNSLTSDRETGLKTLSLINADGTPVSFTTAHAYNHSDLNATGKGTNFGWIYYNNNASVVQEFHIYVPIAVKYNWGNIAFDDRLGDVAGKKLDKDYTQTIWAIITVKGTH